MCAAVVAERVPSQSDQRCSRSIPASRVSGDPSIPATVSPRAASGSARRPVPTPNPGTGPSPANR
ncbi:hypothetical protein [Nonomuraea sp. NPDC048916]|uniref:hypothetical protein n=1 Tax=Nonomuraea sp. NPDC048916 TaxID=3154232 RepID=UPI0033C879BA